MGVWEDATDWYESRQEAAAENRGSVVDFFSTGRERLQEFREQQRETNYESAQDRVNGGTLWDSDREFDESIDPPTPEDFSEVQILDEPPSVPENNWLIDVLTNNPMAIVWVLIFAGGLWLLRPLLEVVAGVTDG